MTSQSVSYCSHHGGLLGNLVDDQQLLFPAGLRVLVVDDDVACLTILSYMLKRCNYQVTTCCQATVALTLLRQMKGGFDVMISDVHMPDMDGYKLLELVGLEMDLPVIMISGDGRTSAVMKGIQYGACDYLVKPVRIEELQNIWQHVVRKKWHESKEVDHSGSLEDSTCCQVVVEEPEANASSTNDRRDPNRKSYKNKRDAKEDEEDAKLGNHSAASKKPRIVWSMELHQQFVNAVKKLGVDKAVPKKILDLMNVPGLTRETVASHLQKFRVYLKRISSVGQHQSESSNILFPPLKVNTEVDFRGGYNSEALADSDQIPPQTLATLHFELLNRPSGGIMSPASPAMSQQILQSSMQRPADIHCAQEVAYDLPILECQPINLRDFHDVSCVSLKENLSCFSSVFSKQHSIKGSTNIPEEVKNDQSSNLLRQMLQQQGNYASIQESSHAISVHSSSLTVASQESMLFSGTPFPANKSSPVISTQSSIGFGGSKIHFSIQNCHTNNNLRHPDHSPAYDVPNGISSCFPPIPGQGLTNESFSCTDMRAGSTSTSVPWFPASTGYGNILLPCNPATEVDLGRSLPATFIMCNQGVENKISTLPTKGQEENLGFAGEGNCISCCFPLDDRSMGTMSSMLSVKQETLYEFADSSEIEATWRMMFPSKCLDFRRMN